MLYLKLNSLNKKRYKTHKLHIIYSILLVILLSCQKQPQKNFIKNIGGSDFDEVYSICLDHQQNIIATGIYNHELHLNNSSVSKSKGGTDIFVVKYNPQGNFLWSKQLGGKSDDWVYSVKCDTNNNIYIAGQNSEKNPGRGAITKFDTHGKVCWNYLHDSSSKFYDVLIQSQTIHCAGSVNGHPAVITLNKKGEKINEVSFPENGVVRGFTSLNSHKFYAFGEKKKHGFIVKLNSSLNILSESSLFHIDSGIVLSLLADENGLLAGGQLYRSQNKESFGKEDAFLISLSHDLEINQFVINGSNEKDWTRSICKISNQRYLISTIVNKNATLFNTPINNAKGNFDISLSLIDKDLNLIENKTIESPLEEGINIVLSKDRMLYLAGWFQGKLIINKDLQIHDNGNGNGFLLKINFNEFLD